jgi:hypothetical protein
VLVWGASNNSLPGKRDLLSGILFQGTGLAIMFVTAVTVDVKEKKACPPNHRPSAGAGPRPTGQGTPERMGHPSAGALPAAAFRH